MKKIITISAIFLATALFFSCSKNDVATLPDNPEDMSSVQKSSYSFNLKAGLGQDPATKAIDAEDATGKLPAHFETSDKIYVYNSSKGYRDDSGYLQPNSNSASATLSGNLKGTSSGTTKGYEVGNNLKLLYNFTETGYAYYTDQKGTFESVQNYDFAEKSGLAITSIEADGSIVTDAFTFTALQSIFKFTFMFGGNPVNVKKVTIGSENNYIRTSLSSWGSSNTLGDLVVNLDTPNSDGVVWAAINTSHSNDNINFTVIDANGVTYVATKATPSGGFSMGKYYTSTINLSKPYNDLSTPLTIEAIDAKTYVVIQNPNQRAIKTSVNGGAKSSSNLSKINIYLTNKGDKVEIYGNSTPGEGSNRNNCLRIYPDQWKKVYVYGNVMSLVDEENFATVTSIAGDYGFAYLFSSEGDNSVYSSYIKSHPTKNVVLPATTLTDHCYYQMFYKCGIRRAPDLPAMTLATSCYSNMFNGCTSLEAAPALPATSLAATCYSSMFKDCSNLEFASSLPAETMQDNCYQSMFSGCSKLVSPPNLPAETLALNCYSGMFQNCSKLVTAPNLPAMTIAEKAYSSMFQGCTSLTAAPNLPATTLAPRCYQSMFSGCTRLASTGSSLPATSIPRWAYAYMFTGCTSLVTAPSIEGTVLEGDNNSAMRSMFSGCTALETGPAELKIATLKDSCYFQMFNNCTSLTSAPKLAYATTLAKHSCNQMFSHCSALVNLPEMPKATVIPERCFWSMFEYCGNLATAALRSDAGNPITEIEQYGCQYMFRYCTSITSFSLLDLCSVGDWALGGMFSYCSSLSNVVLYPPTYSSTSSTNSMLSQTGGGDLYINIAAQFQVSTSTMSATGWTVHWVTVTP